MTREEALKIWLPVIKMGVESMQECNEALNMAIKALEQEPRTGHWEYKEIANTTITGYWCSQCHIGSSKPYDYCPNCGAKMVETQERED